MNLILVCSLAQRWWFRLPVFVSYTCCHLRWTKCLPLSLPYVCNQKESERVTQLVLNISHNCDKILPCLFWSVPNPTHQLMMAHISKISHSSPPHFTPTLHPHSSPPLFTPTLHPLFLAKITSINYVTVPMQFTVWHHNDVIDIRLVTKRD